MVALSSNSEVMTSASSSWEANGAAAAAECEWPTSEFGSQFSPWSSLDRRPPELDSGGNASVTDSEANAEVWKPIPSSPRGSVSSSTPVAAAGIATGDINEHQLYKRFRLSMVQLFGSIASALYEFGCDPEAGRLSRLAFENVCNARLGLMSATEANVLFSHITDACPMEKGVGGHISYRDFGIADQDWRLLCLRKRQAEENRGQGYVPFQSDSRGNSMGSYHRNFKIATSHGDSFAMGGGVRCSPKGSPPSQQPWESMRSSSVGSAAACVPDSPQGLGGAPSLDASSYSAQRSIVVSVVKKEKRVRRKQNGLFPWQQTQRPWSPSTLVGRDPAQDSPRATSRGPGNNPAALCFRTTLTEKMFALGSPFRASPVDRPRSSQLGFAARSQDTCHASGGDRGFLVSECPTRRSEMEPRVCCSQVEPWWAHARPRPCAGQGGGLRAPSASNTSQQRRDEAHRYGLGPSRRSAPES